MKLLKFSAQWCAPCRALDPILDKIMEDYSDIELERIDIEDISSSDTVTEYSIRSIPTLVIVEDGEEKRRMTGSASEEIIRKFIEG